MDNRGWRKSVAVFNRLPELERRVRALREELTQLKQRMAAAPD
jgi:hypothetical protein